MIPNIITHYMEYSDVNKNFYLEVKNQSSFYINILLYYTLGGKRISKACPVFAPTKTQHVSFPDTAVELSFDIYNCYFVPPHLVCKNDIQAHKSSCFKIVTNPQGVTQCVHVGC